MLTYTLAVSIVISALVAIRTAYSPARRRWFYVFKPLTTTLILLAALLTPAFGSSPCAIFIAAGLGFSLAGDIFLMLSDKYFIWGLASFLVAHLCYIPAFISRSGFRESLWISLPFIAAGPCLLRPLEFCVDLCIRFHSVSASAAEMPRDSCHAELVVKLVLMPRAL